MAHLAPTVFELYASFAASTHIPVLLVDRDGVLLAVNHGAEQVYGYAAAELLGASALCTVPAELHPEARALWARVFAGERVLAHDTRRLTKGGGMLDVSLGCAPVRDARGTVVAIAETVDVITERLKLEQSNRDLQQFAFVASHDLKEPLRVVQAYAELLASKWAPTLGEPARTYVGHIHQESRRALGLVHDLLSFARIDQGAPPVHQAVDTTRLVAELVARLTPPPSGAQLAPPIHVEPLPAVRADPAQLRQVFSNLLSNALKFVQPGELPQIVVSGERAGHEVLLCVADRGIGIDGDTPIFDMFGRAPTRTRYEGHGVGLAIVQRIVARHGGRVWHEPHPGGGTRFFVVLPAPPDAP